MKEYSRVSVEPKLSGRELFIDPGTARRSPRRRLKGGARTWYFPDGYLPAKNSADKVDAHEALMILNVSKKLAQLRIDFYFEDRDPILAVPITIGSQRVRCIRLDWPQDLEGTHLPVCTQYAIRVRSNVNIIIQQGRIDTTQSNLSYYGSMGLCER
jgi:hypothetical protein